MSWIYRKQIPDRLLQEKNSETGTILFSNPELTAIDLVQYEQYVGGLSRVSTVLAELVEKTDFSNAVEDYLFDNTSVATIQRLGYIWIVFSMNQNRQIHYMNSYGFMINV